MIELGNTLVVARRSNLHLCTGSPPIKGVGKKDSRASCGLMGPDRQAWPRDRFIREASIFFSANDFTGYCVTIRIGGSLRFIDTFSRRGSLRYRPHCDAGKATVKIYLSAGDIARLGKYSYTHLAEAPVRLGWVRGMAETEQTAIMHVT
jgi:hypothetical protein